MLTHYKFKKLMACLFLVTFISLPAFSQPIKLPDNLVSKRLDGRWKMNLTLTSRISLDRQIGGIRGLEFTRDLGQLAKVPKIYTDRVKPEHFHMAGTIKVEFANGHKSSHPFILTSQKGNTLLWVFTPQSGSKEIKVDTSVVNLIAGQWENDDLLFLGYNINEKPFYIIFERIVEKKEKKEKIINSKPENRPSPTPIATATPTW